MLGGGWERGYISVARLPQQLLEQHALLSLMSWAYSTCAVFALLFQQCAGSGVTFDSTFLFEARALVRCLRRSLREPDCAMSTIDPRSFTLRTSISTTLALDSLQEHGCEKFKCIFKFFTTRLSLINEYEIYGTTYEYIHTYIHTYIQTPLAFNTLMWGSLRLAPINERG